MSKARDVSRLFSKTGSSSSDVGSSTVSSDTPPAGAGAGDEWFNTTNLTTYIYYDDGTSLQWVPASAPVPGPTGATGPAPSINFSAINQAMIPDTDVTYDLGSSTHKWKDLYLSGSTLHLGASATISAGTGSEIVLPSIKIGAGANAVKLSANASGGLETQAVVGGTTQAVKPAGGTVQVADLAAMQAISNPSIGDMVSVVSNKTIYMYNGTGFYKIAVMVNESPTAITGVDASYTLETDGTATTITAISSDPEGRPLTWSYAVSSGTLNGTTVAQTNNVFTITPHASDAATFSITFSVTDSINGAVNAVSAFTLAFSVTNSRYTALSVKATAAGSNQTFDDASTSNHTITVAGDTTASTFSPYRHGGYATYFDGNDRIDISTGFLGSHTTGNASTSTFTIESWVYQEARGSNNGIDGNAASIISKWVYFNFGIDDSGHLHGHHYSGSQHNLETTATVPLKTWTHVALVVTGAQIKLYINGTLGATGTWYGMQAATALAGIGGSNQSHPEKFTGYMHDIRVSDNARYTTNFTPANALTTDSNTDLLIGKLQVRDLSSNSVALTLQGDVKVVPFNTSTGDNSLYSEADHGASVYFGGFGDGINLNGDAEFAFGTNDFTVEFWVYPLTRAATEAQLVDFRGSSGNGTYTLLYLDNQYNTNDIIYYHQGGARITSSAILDNAWSHVALTRSGNDVKLFVNGIQEGSTFTNSLTQLVGTNGPRFGSYHNTAYALTGYMSDIRILNGTAAYTSNFTPPTAPLTAVTNTKFLLNPETSISDLSQKSAITCIADAATSTTQVKFAGTKSIYLDGTGDFLQSSESVNIAGDWTIEGWYYFTTLAADHSFFTIGDSASQANSMEFLYRGASINELRFYNMGGGYSNQHTPPSDFLANNWIHIAVVRSGTGTNNIKAYINGTQSGTGKTSNNDLIGKVNIGTELYNGAGSWFTQGYIQDFRVSSIARYTANFTPPTAELQG